MSLGNCSFWCFVTPSDVVPISWDLAPFAAFPRKTGADITWFPCDSIRVGCFTASSEAGDGPEGQWVQDESTIVCGHITLHNQEELLKKYPKISLYPKAQHGLRLVLELYQQQGLQICNYLLGYFCFIIIDRRSGRLFAAVDHMGIFRLYYRRQEHGSVALSNNLSWLSNKQGSDLNHEYGLSYLTKCFPGVDHTPYNDIKTIPAGSILHMANRTISQEKYWRLENRVADIHTGALAEEALLEILDNSVACRLQQDNNSGIMLSGGLDSSAVACLAARQYRTLPENLHLFSAIPLTCPNNDESDERVYLQAVCDDIGLQAHRVSAKSQATLETLHNYFANRANFPLNPFPFLTEPLVHEAKKYACTRLLTGYGGDEIASTFGLTSLALLLRQLRLGDFVQNAARVKAVNMLSWYNIFRGLTLPPLLPGCLKAMYRQLRGRSGLQALGNRFLRSELLLDSSVTNKIKNGEGHLSSRFLDPRLELVNRLQNDYFRHMLDLDDYFLDVHGVLIEHPLLDKRLVEFILQVHPREFLFDGWNRSLFRRSLKGVVTEKVRRRPGKSPFNPDLPYSQCLVATESLVLAVLHETRSTVWDFLDRDALQTAYQAVKAGVEQGSPHALNGEALMIGRCIVLAAFYQYCNC